MGRPLKSPIYTLPHGIEVIGEYPPRGGNKYWRVRIRPHRFFPGVRVVYGGINIHRSRAILASELGRVLTPTDHAHHGDELRDNDTIENLTLMSAAEHNRHHKTGSKHTDEVKRRIGASVRKAVAAGKMDHKKILRGTDQAMAKLDDDKVRHIRSSEKSAYRLAKELGVSKQTVLAARNRKTWRHVQ